MRIGNLSISLSCCLDGPQNKQGQIASQIILSGWPHAVESVATSSWNPWPHVHGIDGHMRVEYAAQSLHADHQERLMCVLERFAFRYGVLARARIAEYDRKIGPMVTKIRDTPNEYRLADLEAILRDLLDRYATTEALERQLDGLDYDKNKKELKYLLAISEFMSAWYNSQANGRPTVMAPNVSIDIRAMTLEHVSPQNPEEAGVEMLPHLHKLGNLTLLSEDENNRAGNRPFHNKRAILQQSRLQINQVLAENDEWGADQARVRQEALKTQAMRIFDLNF